MCVQIFINYPGEIYLKKIIIILIIGKNNKKYNKIQMKEEKIDK